MQSASGSISSATNDLRADAQSGCTEHCTAQAESGRPGGFAAAVRAVMALPGLSDSERAQAVRLLLGDGGGSE